MESEDKKKLFIFKPVFFLSSVSLLILAIIFTFYFQSFTQNEQMDHKGFANQANSTALADPPSGNEEIVLFVGLGKEDDDHVTPQTISLANYSQKEEKLRHALLLEDSYVSIPGGPDHKLKLAYSYGGIELLIETIEDHFGVNITYYALFPPKGMADLIDFLVPQGFNTKEMESRITSNIRLLDDPLPYLDVGQDLPDTLDGSQTVTLLHTLQGKENSYSRNKIREEIERTLFQVTLTLPNKEEISTLVNLLRNRSETNMSTSSMFSWVNNLVHTPYTELETGVFPLENTYQYETYSHAGDVITWDQTTNERAIEDFFKED
ncbi:LCP family protein [Thalassorhabdus alkalitolerans]|uniref:LCP family protein n=1 Tax=Thalassorhabdus alkalitolerans TaxID=2282697 RepID=A0ABW0YJB9_9BACI